MSTEQKVAWVDASAHDVKVLPIKIPKTGKMILAVYGNISLEQKQELTKSLRFKDLRRNFQSINPSIDFLGVPWTLPNGKPYVTPKFIEQIANVFPQAKMRQMDSMERNTHWIGMLKSAHRDGIYKVAQNPAVSHLLNSKIFVGANVNGRQVYRTEEGARFIERPNGDIILRKSDKHPSSDFLYHDLSKAHSIREVGNILATEYINNGGLNAADVERVINASFNPPNEATKGYGRLFSDVLDGIKTELIGRIRDEKANEPIDYTGFINDTEALFRLPSTPTKSIRNMDSFGKQDNMHLSLMARGFLGFVEKSGPVNNVEVVGEDAVALNTYIPTSVASTLVVDNPNINDQLGLHSSRKLNIVQRDLTKTSTSKSGVIIAASNDSTSDNTPEIIGGITVSRPDHKLAMRTLMSSSESAHTMLVINSDHNDLGIVTNESMPLHEYIFRNFEVLGMVDVDKDIIGTKSDYASKRIYFTGGRRLIPLTSTPPRNINSIDDIEDLFNYSQSLHEKLSYSDKKLITEEEAKVSTNISELLTYYTENQIESSKHQLNELQRRYVPMTNMSRVSDAVIPLHIHDAMKVVYQKLVTDVGNPDHFICKEMGWTPEQFTNVLDATQIDALILSVWNAKRNQNEILADAAGLGKGRILAAFMYWAIKQGETPVFITKDTGLISDIVRDFRNIGVWDEINPFPIASTEIKDLANEKPLWTKNELDSLAKEHNLIGQFSKPETYHAQTVEEKNNRTPRRVKTVNKPYKPIDDKYNIILTSYSQMGQYFNKEHPSMRIGTNAAKRKTKNDQLLRSFATRDSMANKARLVFDILSKSKNPILVMDESHKSTTDSLGAIVIHGFTHMLLKTKPDSFILRSSATAAKYAESAAFMVDVLGRDRMTQREAYNALSNGGLEAYTVSCARNGGMIVRDHDPGTRKTINLLDEERVERNRLATDTLARILNKGADFTNFQAASYMKATSQTTKGSAGDFGFTSPMNLLGDDFNIALLADFVAERCLKSLNEGNKPVVAIEKTQGTAMQGLFDMMLQEWYEADPVNRVDLSRSEIPKKFQLEEMPTFKETLKRWLEREQSITITEDMTQEDLEEWRIANNKGPMDTPKVMKKRVRIHWRDRLEPSHPEYLELHRLNQEILDEIELMPDLPLSPIDHVVMALEEHGYRSGEISGRSISIQKDPDGTLWLVSAKVGDNSEAIIDFQSDKSDAIFYTKSGTTGISLHADIDLERQYGIDVRPRHVYGWSTFSDIADEEQSANRADRKNQKYPAQLFRMMTGLPLNEVKIQNVDRRRRDLTSLRTGSSKSFREFEGGSFINEFGSKQIQYFLMDNKHYIDRLRLSSEMANKLRADQLVESKSTNNNNTYINKIFGRMYYLTCAEQIDFFDSFRVHYNAEYNKELAQGRDPINTTTILADIVPIREQQISGGIDKDTYHNELDRPLYAKFVELKYQPVKLDLEKVLESIDLGKENCEWSDANGRIMALASDMNKAGMKEQFLKTLYEHQTSLWEHWKNPPTFEQAIDKNSENSSDFLVTENERFDLIQKFIPHIRIGGTYNTLRDDYLVILDAHLSKNYDDSMALCDQWSVSVARTENNAIERISFRDLMSTFNHKPEEMKEAFDGEFTPEHEAYDTFLNNSIEGRKERRWILDGNPLEASRLNSLDHVEKIGAMQTIVSSNGDINLCLVASPTWTLNKLMNKKVNCSLQTLKIVRDVIEQNRVKNESFEFYHNLYDAKTKPDYIVRVSSKVGKENFSIHLPKNVTPRDKLNLKYLVEFGVKTTKDHLINDAEIVRNTTLIEVHRDSVEVAFEAIQSRGFNLAMTPEMAMELQETVHEQHNVDTALSSLLGQLHSEKQSRYEQELQSQIEDASYIDVPAPEGIKSNEAIDSNHQDETLASDSINNSQIEPVNEKNQIDVGEAISTQDDEDVVSNTISNPDLDNVEQEIVVELKEQYDMVTIRDGRYVVDNINVEAEKVTFVSRDGSERFVFDREELDANGVAIKGIHDPNVINSTSHPLIAELTNLVSQLNPSKWFDSKGRVTFDMFDDVYDSLISAGKPAELARIKSQEFKNGIAMGEFTLADFGIEITDKRDEDMGISDFVPAETPPLSQDNITNESEPHSLDSNEAMDFTTSFNPPESVEDVNTVATEMEPDFSFENFEAPEAPEPKAIRSQNTEVLDDEDEMSFEIEPTTPNIDSSTEAFEDPLGSVLANAEVEDEEDDMSFNFQP
ncbi:DEAD/DEAH box helicase family protein [Vibrio alginolyticus]|uniref:DEAD/DEAH box helicase family protein n=1 Tax=Vibrio alginolyticus TaxID=663 RepID=UPI0015939D51|nr:DEAD/DEAH box helicase family protein [Vibrio alginolyticus]QKS98420.1 DEAD/DEAH box helicase family protein [Vibrio alginolyticus]